MMTDKNLLKIHSINVQKISSQMKKFFKNKTKVKIYHGSTTSTRTQKFNRKTMIDISSLNNILEIDTKKHILTVEPNVSMDQLVRYTFPYGFVPPIVMEFPGITVGGGIQGLAGESSSFKWGAFHNTCLEYEIVLGNGEIITVSPNKNADLFWGIASSYGSIGIITKIKMKIIPAKPFVKLSYIRVGSFTEALGFMERTVKQHIDFIDCIMFSKTNGTVTVGTFSQKEELPITTFTHATDDWFYTHAEKITKKYNDYSELIPLGDYLFRHDRGTYWIGKYLFQKLHIPFNRLTRWILDPLLRSRILARVLQSINVSQRQFVQDFYLPKGNTLSLLQFIDKKLHIYPLYICPGVRKNTPDKLCFTHAGLSFDVGVWGHLGYDYNKFVKVNREAEKELTRLNGRKMLYAHQYYTREEFWKVYNLEWYSQLRKKYHAEEVFLDIYEKTFVKEKYEYSVLKGLLHFLQSPFTLPINV